MRISTSAQFNRSLDQIMRQQSDLHRTQLQMNTMSKMLQAADDPAAASGAQKLDHTLAQLQQMSRDGDRVGLRLNLQEQALGDAGDIMMRASELAVRGNSPSLSQDERKMIAIEIRALRADLLGVANRDDGNGRSLFAGNQQGIVPFTDNAGTVSYMGDDGRNDVEISPGVQVADAEPGSRAFMRVATGDGQMRAEPAAANTGNLALQYARTASSATWQAANTPLQLMFDDAENWRLLDAAGDEIGNGAYTSGTSIVIAGVDIRLSGTPAAGDSVAIGNAANRDVFNTLDQLASALEAPLETPKHQADAKSALGNLISDLGRGHDHLLTIRADVGMRMARIDTATDTRAGAELGIKETLSGLRDLDFTEASGRLAQQITALDAAQAVMVKMRSLSLFERL